VIIKANGNYLQLDGEIEHTDDGFKAWAFRWNRSEGRFSTQSIEYKFKTYLRAEEKDLPQPLPRLEFDDNNGE